MESNLNQLKPNAKIIQFRKSDNIRRFAIVAPGALAA